MAKRLLTRIRIVDEATGRTLSKHHHLMPATEKAAKLAKKGVKAAVYDEFGLYYRPKHGSNPHRRRSNAGGRQLYFVEYMQAGSGVPVDVTAGLRSMAQARVHGLKVTRDKGYSGFWISSKPEGSTTSPKRIKFVEVRRKLSNRFVPAKIKARNGKLYSGEARKNPKTGRIQIRVSQQTARKMKINPLISGTSYFVSRSAAERYYKDYGYDDVKAAVKRKLSEGEIHIGKPALKPGDRLILLDSGKRYGIQEG